MQFTLSVRGDQIGSYSNMSGTGNGTGRVVTLQDVEAFGASSDVFTILVEQVSPGDEEFKNGQWITVFDAENNIVVPRINVQPDEEQGHATGDEHLVINSMRVVIDLGGVPEGPQTVQFSQGDQSADLAIGDNDGNLDFMDFPCLASGSLVETASGVVPVEELRVGQDVLTCNEAPSRIKWIGSRTLRFSQNGASSVQAPILFKSGCFGQSRPKDDLVVSPHHRVLLSGQVVDALFGSWHVLAPAKGLLGLSGVRQMKGKKEVTYYTILLESHAVMRVNGAFVESFFPGRQAMSTLDAEQQAEICAIIPGFAEWGTVAYGASAERFLSVKEAKRLTAVADAAMLTAGSALLAKGSKPFVPSPSPS